MLFQRVQEAEAALSDVHLVEEMTPQQLQYLELINVNNSVMMDQLEEKFAELKEDIGQVKVIKFFFKQRTIILLHLG